MAAITKGDYAHAKSDLSRQCEATSEKTGLRCRAWAMREAETCWLHSQTKAEQLSAARRGGLKTAQLKREKKAGSPRSGLVPHASTEQLLQVCIEGLQATFADAGLPNEIDHQTRLLSVAALLNAFPRYYRSTPQEAAALLLKVLPERLDNDEVEQERGLCKRAEAAYVELRRAWDSERFAGELRGSYQDESYPAWAIAPWESAVDLNAARAKWVAGLRANVGDGQVTGVFA